MRDGARACHWVYLRLALKCCVSNVHVGNCGIGLPVIGRDIRIDQASPAKQVCTASGKSERLKVTVGEGKLTRVSAPVDLNREAARGTCWC